MFDPGALGTLIIGLRANDAELDFGSEEGRRQPPTPTRLQPTLSLIARSLRRLADRLEPGSLEAEPAC